MTAVNELLDKVRKTCSIASDNALAGRFDVKRQTVSKWRNADAYPSEEHIAQLAQLAGDDPELWLIRVQAERSTGIVAASLLRAVRKLEALAACILTAAGSYALSRPAWVSELSSAIDFARMYIMSKRWNAVEALRRLQQHAPRLAPQ